MGLYLAYIIIVHFVFPITDDDKLWTLKRDELGSDSISQ
jgi:hypothetical protein